MPGQRPLRREILSRAKLAMVDQLFNCARHLVGWFPLTTDDRQRVLHRGHLL